MIYPVKEKIILGIDPGTTIMGYGVLRVTGVRPELLTMGVIDLRKYADHYLKLRRIFERVSGIIESYAPDELAIEAPFYGKNVQSMLKLGRAQGVAMAAALHHDIPITEYAPLLWNDEKNCWVIELDMVECEKTAGLLKMDVRLVRC